MDRLAEIPRQSLCDDGVVAALVLCDPLVQRVMQRTGNVARKCFQLCSEWQAG
jgi:hypothetical protein